MIWLSFAEPPVEPVQHDVVRLLRLEMGNHLVSHDTDGLTNPYEIGSDWAIKTTRTATCPKWC